MQSGSWLSSGAVRQWQWAPFALVSQRDVFFLDLGAYPVPPGSVRNTMVINLAMLESWHTIKILQSVLAMMHEAACLILIFHLIDITVYMYEGMCMPMDGGGCE